MNRHAKKKGCRLIIDPRIDMPSIGKESIRIRVETLLEFLEDDSVRNIEVVISERARDGNYTMIGDWFLADSKIPLIGEGYRQTFFIRHAPTTHKAAIEFDQEFNEICNEQKITPAESKDTAIQQIKKILKEL